MRHQFVIAIGSRFRAIERQAGELANLGIPARQRADSLSVYRADNPDEVGILIRLATEAEAQLRDHAKIWATLQPYFRGVESASRLMGHMAEKQAQDKDTAADRASVARVEQERTKRKKRGRSQSGRLQRDMPRAKKGKGGFVSEVPNRVK